VYIIHIAQSHHANTGYVIYCHLLLFRIVSNLVCNSGFLCVVYCTVSGIFCICYLQRIGEVDSSVKNGEVYGVWCSLMGKGCVVKKVWRRIGKARLCAV
jgi:hypothetical protein